MTAAASHSLEMSPGPSATTPGEKHPNSFLQASQHSSQADLPPELLQDIFSYLSPRDYESARLACQRWYAASLCKPLLLNLLAAMKFDPFDSGCPCFDKPSFYTSTPPTTNCPETCPCNYQFPETPMATWDLKSLRVAFALALDKHASSVRVACGKLVLDMSTFLKNPNTDWGYSDAPREVESLSFSKKSGSFVGIVTKVTKNGKVERKLWIHRLFTSRHSPFNKIARPDDGFLFFVEGSRHLPGQLYMTMELSKFPEIPVVDLKIEEHSAFSGVRKIVIKYINCKEEEITFNKFKPDIQNPANSPRDDGTLFYDRKGITYRSNQAPWTVKQKTKGKGKGVGTGIAKPKGWMWGSVPIWKKDLPFRKDIVVYEDSLQKRTIMRTSRRVLAIIGDEPLQQMCFRLTLPLSSSAESGYSSVIIAPNCDIFVCAPSLSTSSQDQEVAHVRYKFQVAPRASEPAGARITHLTVAPQYKYDIGRGFWWMAICAAYDNGEIWMWRVDMEVLLRKDGIDSTLDGAALIRAPGKVASANKNRSCYPTARQVTCESIPQRNPGDFDPEIGECVAVNLCSFTDRTLSEYSTTKKVKVIIPPTEELGYMRALKLGYMPGLEALNFVGRGRTVMAGTKKEIVVWDMRMWNGFERGKLKAEF